MIHVRLHVDSLWAHSWSRDSIRNWDATIIILEFAIIFTGPSVKISEIFAVGDSLKGKISIFCHNSQNYIESKFKNPERNSMMIG